MPKKATLKSQLMKWGKVLLVSIVLALILRCFFVESYRMPSSQMENSILCGDYMFVNKTAYGIRLPITWLSIPFMPDSLPSWGISTYSTKLQLPYTRLLKKQVVRNDIVVYNTPLYSSDVPLDKAPLSISRCVGLPGDTIEVKNTDYFVNGKKLPQSPDMVLGYNYPIKFNEQIQSVMTKLNIPVKGLKTESGTITIFLSRYNHYQINEELPDSIVLEPNNEESLSYKLCIPKKDLIVKLSPDNIHEYQQIIMEQEKGKAEFKDGKLYIENRPTDCYKFNKDYYWMLSDNTTASADSRHFGFIPHSHLIGRVDLIWFSKEPNNDFVSGYRWNRIFIKAH